MEKRHPISDTKRQLLRSQGIIPSLGLCFSSVFNICFISLIIFAFDLSVFYDYHEVVVSSSKPNMNLYKNFLTSIFGQLVFFIFISVSSAFFVSLILNKFLVNPSLVLPDYSRLIGNLKLRFNIWGTFKLIFLEIMVLALMSSVALYLIRPSIFNQNLELGVWDSFVNYSNLSEIISSYEDSFFSIYIFCIITSIVLAAVFRVVDVVKYNREYAMTEHELLEEQKD